MSESEAQPRASAEASLDTFPKLLLHHARVRPDRPAIREKDYGIWQTWTWREVADEVRALACGLAAMGFRRGDMLAIVGDNRPRLYWSMAAAQALGGVPVPLYQDSVAEEMQYVLDHSGARFAVVEDQEQVDKLLEIRGRCPALEHIIYDDPRGLKLHEAYRRDDLHDYEDVIARGRAHDAAHPGFFEGEVAAGRGGDLSIILYTSGTTGKPKGVCHTHEAFIFAARGGVEFDRLGPDDNVLSYLPMAWVGDHLFSYAQALVAGFAINCPESGDTVMIDMRELGPSYYFAPPRIYENLLTQVMIRMEDASRIKQAMFHYFMGVARRCGADLLAGRPVPLKDRLLYALGRWLVYEPLKNVLGMSRLRVAYTAGAAIGPDLFRFYRSLGINLKQLYGSTETCAYVCLQPDDDVKLDTVGVPAPGVELRIADNGEVLVRGPMLFKEYYKRPDATAEALDEEGWFHTGDAGILDEDGHLKIIDRAKDVGRLNDGSMFAPNYIENKLKFFSYIKEAVVFGNGRDFVAAFVNIDLEAVGNWAERRGLAYGGYTDLAAKPEVYDLVHGCIEQVNRDLAGEPGLASSQIRRYLILHKELDADDGELTRTRKVRRRFIAEKYGDLIEALYDGRPQCHVRTEVTFEDGRKGVIEADVRIRDVEALPPAEPMRKAS
ncbi:AMP-dependent synthetase/ligase [Inmirania thermothiophila]|uniref:Long-chain acyl-CoA synthetase n=1 Tax=Inmirania thermothiophila TaxID=1750597 RepID=A0A3N1Y8T8_9GAMM|nr:AMP-binding protein [Inmirania thermothiophila]ROR35213.1 long-chain acyl-CoA synthetase [Inmirania thermothiophila]